MDKRCIWLVVQNMHDNDPIFTCFDNQEAAYTMRDYLMKYGSVYVERMPVYSGYKIADGDNEEGR